jgi:sirohydrochlorin cobaltochelatase
MSGTNSHILPSPDSNRMSITLENVLALESLEAKLRAILPEQYRDSYEQVVPVSMGSAGLKYDADGRVAWDQIWGSFCDLAMAGGPPHRGTLLETATTEAVAADPEAQLRLMRVVEEIRRGISLVTRLPVLPAAKGSSLGVRCRSVGMAAWLVRAIVMENIQARHDAEILILPAGPDFRLAKEIKNVITATAKTCHYWTDHMSVEQHESIDAMLANRSIDSELLEPALPIDVETDPEGYRKIVDELTRQITARTGRICFANRYMGWIGIDCPDVRTAIWLMRAMTVENILARREDTVLFLPAHPRFASDGRMTRLVETFERVHQLCAVKKFE